METSNGWPNRKESHLSLFRQTDGYFLGEIKEASKCPSKKR